MADAGTLVPGTPVQMPSRQIDPLPRHVLC